MKPLLGSFRGFDPQKGSLSLSMWVFSMYICEYNYKTSQTPEQDSETHFMCSSEPDGAAAGKHVVCYYSLRTHLAAGNTDVNLSRCFPEPLIRTFTKAAHFSKSQIKVC